MKLQFGHARNGWLPFELEVEGESLELVCSYLPNDFLSEFSSALIGVIKAEGTHVARTCMEPEELEWQFIRIQNTLSLILTLYPGSERHKQSGEKLLVASGDMFEILTPLWRGLNELARRPL